MTGFRRSRRLGARIRQIVRKLRHGWDGTKISKIEDPVHRWRQKDPWNEDRKTTRRISWSKDERPQALATLDWRRYIGSTSVTIKLQQACQDAHARNSWYCPTSTHVDPLNLKCIPHLTTPANFDYLKWEHETVRSTTIYSIPAWPNTCRAWR